MIVAVPKTQAELASDALYEVVDGVYVEKPVSMLSIWIATNLYDLMAPFAKTGHLGKVVMEMVFILDAASNLRRRPDIAFVSAAKWPLDRLPAASGDWAIAPELAIEVCSPTNTFAELARKVREYFQHGVVEVWIVVPEERQVYTYRSPRDVHVLQAADVLSTPLLPEWSTIVGDVIPDVPQPAIRNGDE